ncbi:M23 family metallopeptidase [Catenulispora sp. NF23]|uniref:M23 family metallopeptidase n=1 Tax=Catenulispora pinistramenti TaxID=2705254 RepID=UPI001BAD9932|nr:M23 family metallopeptidase [Catenulispora pinistramenti]MBS2535586.1 M23 family metallopeptidase [Catenulispora pinistramenti]
MHDLNDADPGDPRRVGSALERLLTASVSDRRKFAPKVADAIGDQEFQRVLDETVATIGVFTAVEDSPDGLVVIGVDGRMSAWGRTDPDGTLSGLLLRPYRGPERGASKVLGRVLALGLTATALFQIWRCWNAASVSAWAVCVLEVAMAYAFIEGFWCPAAMRWRMRQVIAGGVVVSAVSAYRLSSLPRGSDAAWAICCGVVLIAMVAIVVVSRRHRWGTSLSRPLRFPLDGGGWIVAQGGGRLMNHHVVVEEQRGAVDLVRSRSESRQHSEGDHGAFDGYRAYGARVHAPCDGLVVSAVDGLPDQPVGRIRYGPASGNHVSIDTGSELVHLAHLRPGTVTVAIGDRVAVGQPLGEVGNSGNTTEPHLHLHAARDGLGLDLSFEGVSGSCYRGRVLRVRRRLSSGDRTAEPVRTREDEA